MIAQRPLLFRNLEAMIPGEPLPGSYDEERSIWTVPHEEGARSIAETGGRTLEIQTKTKVLQEVDDEIPGNLQMMTKTFVNVERDEDDEDDELLN